jgi:hypothetical protein
VKASTSAFVKISAIAGADGGQIFLCSSQCSVKPRREFFPPLNVLAERCALSMAKCKISVAVDEDAYRNTRAWAAENETSISAIAEYCIQNCRAFPLPAWPSRVHPPAKE